MKKYSQREINQMDPDEYTRMYANAEFRAQVNALDFTPQPPQVIPEPSGLTQGPPSYFSNGLRVEFSEPQSSKLYTTDLSAFKKAAQAERDAIAANWNRSKNLPTLPQE